MSNTHNFIYQYVAQSPITKIFLMLNQTLNYTSQTYSKCSRHWFTCRAVASAEIPESGILFRLRLYTVKEKQLDKCKLCNPDSQIKLQHVFGLIIQNCNHFICAIHNTLHTMHTWSKLTSAFWYHCLHARRWLVQKSPGRTNWCAQA